ncbi:MAG TPA: protease inhibitor I42 family protein [Caulobacteraceae bacterium]|jgi:predicted secreted protein
MDQTPGPGETPAAEVIELSGVAGDVIELPMRDGPATGYTWQLSLPNNVFRIADGPEREPNPASALGSATGGAYRVTAQRGDHVIGARLARPWAPGDAVRVLEIRLHVE